MADDLADATTVATVTATVVAVIIGVAVVDPINTVAATVKPVAITAPIVTVLPASREVAVVVGLGAYGAGCQAGYAEDAHNCEGHGNLAADTAEFESLNHFDHLSLPVLIYLDLLCLGSLACDYRLNALYKLCELIRLIVKLVH